MKDTTKKMAQVVAKKIKAIAEAAGENYFTSSGFYKPAKPVKKQNHEV